MRDGAAWVRNTGWPGVVENYRETAKYVDETVIPAAKEAKEFVTVRPPLRPARLPLRGAAPQAAGKP